jgi:hypothetical protein
MRRALIVFALLASTAQAQRLYHLSVGAQVAAQGMDVASSWGGIEANPRLFAGQRFGWKATTLKLGVSLGGLAIQRYVLRKHPQHRKVATFVNFATAGATAGVAVRNWRMR